MLHLQKYDFDLEFAPGRKIVVADALSRTHPHRHMFRTTRV